MAALYFSTAKTFNKENKNISSQNDYNIFSYDNFWHKFNTYAVIMINLKNSNHLVSQDEINNFQNKFLKDFDLTNNEKNIERNGILINPEILFCYMKFYEPEKNNVLTVRKKCDE